MAKSNSRPLLEEMQTEGGWGPVRSSNTSATPSGQQEIALYTTPEGVVVEVEVRVDAETVVLSLDQIAKLFGRHKSVVSRHLRNVFTQGELDRAAVVAKNATTAADGKTYWVEYFDLDAILSVGYRVNSKQGSSSRRAIRNRRS